MTITAEEMAAIRAQHQPTQQDKETYERLHPKLYRSGQARMMSPRLMKEAGGHLYQNMFYVNPNDPKAFQSDDEVETFLDVSMKKDLCESEFGKRYGLVW